MYTLDPQAARKADQTGNRISEIGKYVGVFTQAEDLTSAKKTKGVGFRFESNGQNANLSIYTQMANGDKLMGYDMLMAIMTCMKLRGLSTQTAPVKYWDNETRKELTRPGVIFPDLQGKQIGLLLETEDYLKSDGTTTARMVIAGTFQAGTELTAGEILDNKTTPEQLPKMIARLKHRPVKGAKHPAINQAQTPAVAGSGFNDMDDDIPF